MEWSAGLAYVVGLIVTDGSLSSDGRHIDFTSKDVELVQTFMSVLGLKNKIGIKGSSFSREKKYFRVQFGNVKLYRFLVQIGLMPNKTKALSSLTIPDQYFIDFLRGHLDGDGSTYSYWDKRWKSSFMLYTYFISASEKHILWMKEMIFRLFRLNGVVSFSGKSIYSLSYAKQSSVNLLNKIYYKRGLPCLERKRSKIFSSLGIIQDRSE